MTITQLGQHIVPVKVEKTLASSPTWDNNTPSASVSADACDAIFQNELVSLGVDTLVLPLAPRASTSAPQGTAVEVGCSLTPSVRCLHIKRAGAGEEERASSSLNWTDIQGASEGDLRWIEASFGVYQQHIRSILEDKDPSSGYRFPKYLMLRTDEIHVKPGSKYQSEACVETNRCVIICGDNFIITVARKRPTCVERVWSELLSPNEDIKSPSSSNTVASRIIGSSLHVNEHAIHSLSKTIDTFVETQSSKLPTGRDLNWTRVMTRDLGTCRQTIESMNDILDRLQEEQNLFGETKASDAIDRYQGLVRTIKERIEHSRQEVRGLEDSWRSTSSKWQGDVLFRLAILSGLCAPISVVSSVLGANFGIMPTDSWMWAAIGGAAVVSVALVSALVFGKKAAER